MCNKFDGLVLPVVDHNLGHPFLSVAGTGLCRI